MSPISGRLVFRGQADLRMLFDALYATVSGVRWTHEVGDDAVRVLIGEARVGPLSLTDAMVVSWRRTDAFNDSDRICAYGSRSRCWP